MRLTLTRSIKLFCMASSQPADEPADPLVLYSRSLYEYTFLLWQESKRVVDETSSHTKSAAGLPGKEKTKEDVRSRRNSG